MVSARRYVPEFILLIGVAVISVLGFWDLYLAPGAAPKLHHHLHLVTSFSWLSLLFLQLTHVARNRYASHRKTGLAVLLVAPLVVATTAFLSVLSAQRAAAAGQGDTLIVQNVFVTAQLAILIFAAFLFRKRRALHGALLTSTSILFGGIALFFALISFVPAFRIEGPETFYRFETAAMTGLGICLVAGLGMFLTDMRNRWPYLLAALLLLANTVIEIALQEMELQLPLTTAVASIGQPLAFVGTFVALLALLAATLLPALRVPAKAGN